MFALGFLIEKRKYFNSEQMSQSQKKTKISITQTMRPGSNRNDSECCLRFGKLQIPTQLAEAQARATVENKRKKEEENKNPGATIKQISVSEPCSQWHTGNMRVKRETANKLGVSRHPQREGRNNVHKIK